MFDIWRKNRQLRQKEIELSIREHDLAIKTLNTVLEARNEVVDSDVTSGWELLGSYETQMSEKSHKDMLTAAYQLYHTNPHARAIIRSLVKFTLGKGPTLIPEEEDNKKVKEVWEKFKKENKFNKREKELAMRLFRDGEFFLRKFVDKTDGTTKVRFIRANRIAAPNDKQTDPSWSYGIKTDPQDIETPLKYCLVDNDGNQKEVIDASEIIHEKILADSDQKRGISVLRVSAKRIRQYDEWLEDRIVLNKVRSAVALIRNIDSSSAKVNDIRSENLSDRFSSTRKKQKMLNRGTIITASKGVTYEMLSPKIQASDVVEDGRSILLAIAAASGLPEMLFTSDYSNANYSSTLVAQNPFVREIEDWQDFLECFYKELFETVVENAKEFGKLPKDVSTECRVDFPPMIQAELDKLAKAFEILFKYKIVSKKTWRGRMGLDDDIEKANIEDEEGDGVYLPGMPIPGQPIPGQPVPGKGPKPGQKSPFNMPIAPINQYSSEVIQAIREADWDKVIELADKIEALEKKSSVKKLAEERITKIAEEDPDFCNEIDDFPDENFLWVDEDGNRFFPYRDGCGDVVKAALVGVLSVIDGHEDELPEEVLSKLEDLLKEYSIDKENITESDYSYECVGGKGHCGTGAGGSKGGSRTFDNKKDEEEWVEKVTGDFLNSLSNEEKEVMRRFTGESNTINRYLRFNKETTTTAKKDIDVIDKLMKKTEVPESIYTFRGVEGKEIRPILKLKEGDTFIDKGFSSTTLNKTFADSFTGWSKTSTLLTIRVPKGKGIAIFPNKYQSEVLLNRNMKYKIVSKISKIIDKEKTLTSIELEVVK